MHPQIHHGLTSYQLKWIAILSMVWDHVIKANYYFIYMGIESLFQTNPDTTYSIYSILSGPGRIAFPLFAFMISQGCKHTHNSKRYLLRLGLLACLSEIPFQWFICYLNEVPLSLHWGFTNVFVTLFLGALTCCCDTYLKNKNYPSSIRFLFVAFIIWLGWYLACDYGGIGILLIYMFYLCQTKTQLVLGTILTLFLMYPINDTWLMISSNQLDMFSIWISFLSYFFSLLSLPFLIAYNNTLGRSAKYLFYAFYPLHLWILLLIHIILFP